MKDKPTVDYPASVMGSVVARADMESASPLRQSLRAAGVQLPEELSASNSVGASRYAMMDDQSLCKGGWVKATPGASNGHRVGGALHLFLHLNSSVIRFAIAQRRIADAGQQASRLGYKAQHQLPAKVFWPLPISTLGFVAQPTRCLRQPLNSNVRGTRS